MRCVPLFLQAKDLAEMVMQAVFEWNTAHEVLDTEIPWWVGTIISFLSRFFPVLFADAVAPVRIFSCGEDFVNVSRRRRYVSDDQVSAFACDRDGCECILMLWPLPRASTTA